MFLISLLNAVINIKKQNQIETEYHTFNQEGLSFVVLVSAVINKVNKASLYRSLGLFMFV